METRREFLEMLSSVFITKLHVPILMYHHITKEFSDKFESQIFSLIYEFGYIPIGFDVLRKGFDRGRLPERPVIATFDDGWKNQYEVAFPILKKYSCLATFFIVTNHATAGSKGNKLFMSWEEIKEMREYGMTIGGHSSSHPYLAREYPIRGDTWLNYEIQGSKKQIEDVLGKDCDDFAYPFGNRDDWVISFVRNAGYKSACDAGGGGRQSGDKLFNLRRVSMGVQTSLDIMYARLQW